MLLFVDLVFMRAEEECSSCLVLLLANIGRWVENEFAERSILLYVKEYLSMEKENADTLR